MVTGTVSPMLMPLCVPVATMRGALGGMLERGIVTYSLTLFEGLKMSSARR